MPAIRATHGIRYAIPSTAPCPLSDEQIETFWRDAGAGIPPGCGTKSKSRRVPAVRLTATAGLSLRSLSGWEGLGRYILRIKTPRHLPWTRWKTFRPRHSTCWPARSDAGMQDSSARIMISHHRPDRHERIARRASIALDQHRCLPLRLLTMQGKWFRCKSRTYPLSQRANTSRDTACPCQHKPSVCIRSIQDAISGTAVCRQWPKTGRHVTKLLVAKALGPTPCR